jgi:predicted outer membrane protein
MEIKTYLKESGHWYTRSGEPMYTVQGAKGQQRNTTLRDARKLDLVPSVTTILNVAAKPGLEAWKQQQILLAALTLPRAENESIDAYAERVIQDSKQQSQEARDLGTEIHAQVQGAFEGGADNDYSRSVKQLLDQAYGKQTWISERSFAHRQGFGGKVDLYCNVAVVDIKTKAFGPGDDPQGFDEHLMQLAAYRSGLIGIVTASAKCANLFVSTTHPIVSLYEWTEDDLIRGWKMFESLLRFWQAKNNYQ